MITITTNNNNDIFIDKYNNLSMTSNIDALANVIKNVILTRYNELLYNQEKGVKYFETIFNDKPDITSFQVSIIKEVLKVDKVLKVINFKYEIINNLFKYELLIQTEFGEVIING